MHRWWFLGVLLTLACTLADARTRLTQAQQDRLKVDVTVTHRTEFAEALDQVNVAPITAAYNTLVAPAFWVFKTSIGEKEIYEVTVEGKTWDWVAFQTQTQTEQNAWRTQINPGTINPSLAQTRAGIDKIFKGTGADMVAMRAFFAALYRREALRTEQLFATSGAGTTTDPAVMGLEGKLTNDDVSCALWGGAPCQ